MKIYDLIIIGAGPAGLAAGIYSSRYNLKNLIISETLGGMAQEAWHIENYPGIIKISGQELTQKMAEQAKALGSEILIDQVGKVSCQKKIFQVKTVGGKFFQSRSLILAMGTKNRQLNVPGEAQFLGRGVSYCFTCEGIFYRDKTVAVVGGGNAAVNAALALARYTKKVYILVRKNKMRAQDALINKIKKNKKIKILYNCQVKNLEGKEKLEKIILAGTGRRSVPTRKLTLDGLFIEIGTVPSDALREQLAVERDQLGYIKVDTCQKTNVSGVFAAGSITSATCYLNQIVVVAAQGAVAAHSANVYLKQR